MEAHLCFLFFTDPVKVLVCDCIKLKSFRMKCHLCVHVLTQDGLKREEDLLSCFSHHDCRCHLQVLYLFGLKFLHVIFKACGGPQTLNFSFLEGRFELDVYRKTTHRTSRDK